MAGTTTRSRQSNREKDTTKDRSRASSRGGSASRETSRVRSGSSTGEPQPKNANAAERKFLDKNKAQLSKTTLRAKWTHSPDEHEDRSGQTLATRSPDVIRRWAEDRGATPATTASIPEGERPRTLRFDFPAGGQSGRSGSASNRAGGNNARGNDTSGNGRGRRGLRPVSWDEWLGVFKDRDLVFLYQEHRRDGGDSNFFRLDSPKREEG